MSEKGMPVEDCAIDDSFTGLVARVKAAGLKFAAERDDWKAVVGTLVVNLERDPASAPHVAKYGRALLEGKTAAEAIALCHGDESEA